MRPIHPKLHEQLIKLTELASEKGVSIDYSSTKNETAALLYDDKKIVMITLTEHADHYLAQPYIVDIHKWAWAETEGFTKEDIFSDKSLQEMIFIAVNRRKMYDYLGIN